MSTRYTFARMYAAHTMRRDDYVYIPDQVAEAQKEFDGSSFPVLRRDGRKARATLRGDEYDLWGRALATLSSRWRSARA